MGECNNEIKESHDDDDEEPFLNPPVYRENYLILMYVIKF